MYCRRILAGLTLLVAVATAAEGALSVVCVPGNGQDTSVPHVSYSGYATTLKGIVRDSTGTFDWSWDPGDGSPPYMGTASTNTYVIEATHTYTGAVGDTFTATLTVDDGTNGSDDYYVELMDGTSLAVQTSIAIDKALWNLHSTMTRTTLSGISVGHWGTGYGTTVAAAAAEAFAAQGHLPGSANYNSDPYVETVQRASDYWLVSLAQITIGAQAPGNPDVSGNGLGFYLEVGSPDTYATGIALMSLAACRSPTRTVGAGVGAGMTHAAIAQEMVEYLAWGMHDVPPATGWRYSHNQGSADNDCSRWAVMGLEAAERELGVSPPAWVKTQAKDFATYVQHGSGFSGYTNSGTITSVAKTSALLCEFFFNGDAVSDTGVANAIGYMGMAASWGNPTSAGNGWNSVGNYCAMRGVKQGLSLYGQMTLNNGTADFDWYTDSTSGLAPALVATQGADGRWTSGAFWTNSYTPMGTGLVVATLSESVISLSMQSITVNGWDDDPNPGSMAVTVTDLIVGLKAKPLSWTSTAPPAWLGVAGGTGVSGDTVTLDIDIATSGPRNEVFDFQIIDPNASNSPRTIPISLNIQSRPEISLSANSVTFYAIEGGADPANQGVTITDANVDANPELLTWTAAEVVNEAWLNTSDPTGTDGETVTLSVTAASLSAGTYNAIVRVTDPDASNSPQDIAVTFIIQSEPIISLSPATVSFDLIAGDANPTPQSVTVNDTNPGANPITMAWTAAENPDRTWLSLTNASGAAGESVSLSVALTSLGAGNYSTDIDFTDASASNSPQTAPVSVIVRSRPIIGFSQSIVDFAITVGDADPAPVNVTITDTNVAANPITLAWTASEAPDATWLTLTNATGASGDDVTLTVAGAGVPTGVNTAHVEVIDGTAGATAQTITVRFTVTPVGGFQDISSFIGDGCAADADSRSTSAGAMIFYALAACAVAAALAHRRSRASA